MIEIKTPAQLIKMRAAGLIVAEGLDAMREAAQPGVTTREVDAVGRAVLAKHGAASSFLNYGEEYGPGFAGVACISVNEEIVHGVPGERVIRDGDLVSIDFGAILDGWHGDAARSFVVGEGKHEHAQLVNDTKESMWRGIAAARIGGRVGEISASIQDYIKRRPTRYGIIREYTGHGIGSKMHMEPDVPNFGRRSQGPKIQEGMSLAIEPMVVLGTHQTAVLDDEWTVVTRDSSWSAHYENTMTVTSKGIWVLTELDGGAAELARLGVPFGPLCD